MEQRGTRLEGKVAIVTGAGTATDVDGTGQAMAILFARHGAKVIVADMSEENAQKTIDTIEATGGTASLFTVDVTKNAECKAMVDAAVERYGGLDILINNVGIGRGGTAVEVSEEEWDLVLNVNLKSMMLTSKHAIPIMIEGGGGTIVNLSSINGLRAGWIADVHYSAAKGGVVAMTKNMAVHHGRDNIPRQCHCPRTHSRINCQQDFGGTPRDAPPRRAVGNGGYGVGCRLGGVVLGKRRSTLDFRYRSAG